MTGQDWRSLRKPTSRSRGMDRCSAWRLLYSPECPHLPAGISTKPGSCYKPFLFGLSCKMKSAFGPSSASMFTVSSRPWAGLRLRRPALQPPLLPTLSCHREWYCPHQQQRRGETVGITNKPPNSSSNCSSRPSQDNNSSTAAAPKQTQQPAWEGWWSNPQQGYFLFLT